MKKTIIWIIVIIALLAGIVLLVKRSQNRPPTAEESLASCLAERGWKFYGAYWCPHCQNQKLMFGKGKDELPYVECSKAGGREQTQACIDAKVDSYPTWELPDGSRLMGKQQLSTLSERSGCAYTGTDTSPVPVTADETTTTPVETTDTQEAVPVTE